jgi:hypothetical protein
MDPPPPISPKAIPIIIAAANPIISIMIYVVLVIRNTRV